MKTIKILLAALLISSGSLVAHNLDYSSAMPRKWKFKSEEKSQKLKFKRDGLQSKTYDMLLPATLKPASKITGCKKTVTPPPAELCASYLLSRDGRVFLELADGNTQSFAFESLSDADQAFVKQKEAEIAAINRPVYPETTQATSEPATEKLPLFFCFTGTLFFLAFAFRKSPLQALGSMSLVSASLFFIPGFRIKDSNAILANDPLAMDSAFVPFKPDVYTRWDNNWFYVESKGIPKHEMMTGITGWQRQVPIQQCYVGNNAWQIPMNPVMATDPIPVNQQHFTRGGIAVAVNGIAIFNPYTNTGLDALVDGQLDNWGGHSGRADDYHYHIAPLHLYAQSNPSLPIAYGFDGFPVFGSTEPNGAAMEALDANHGHFWNGKYHYHGTSTFPYMIGRMAGVVTEDSTHQIIPQSRAKGVRPSGTPLNGAAIVGFETFPGGRSYAMHYTLSGQNYAWIYSWNQAVTQYTFRYCTPTDTTTTNYNGPGDCILLTGTNRSQIGNNSLKAWPNPLASGSNLHLALEGNAAGRLQFLRLMSADGKTTQEYKSLPEFIHLQHVKPGVYLLQAGFSEGEKLSQRILVQ